jgi:hypothetical protein
MAQRQCLAGKRACGRGDGGCGCKRGERKCDEEWQDSYFFNLSHRIHGCSFRELLILFGHKFAARAMVAGFL